MDRTITAKIADEERPLNYSVEVMFDMSEKFGDIKAALDTLEQNNKAGFEALRWFAIRMANDGELCRRECGYDPLPMLKESDISLRMSPLDYGILKAAVVDAIVLGYRRECEGEEVDVGLQELESKKAKAGE